MNAEQILALLSSGRSTDRRLASREIASDPQAVDRGAIEAALNQESVPQIRQSLVSALESLEAQKPPVAEPPAQQAQEIYDEAYLDALRQVTQSLLHQINPIIGDIEQAAKADIAEYDESHVARSIAQIRLQTDAISKLYNASKVAVFEEFDLSEAIRNCLPDDLEHSRCAVDFAGPPHMTAQGDASLITIAVTNGLRNAIEACLAVASANVRPRIVINWNATDRDYWISIMDEGVGFRGSVTGAFEIGTSSKGHSGHGLPAARAAMLSLTGTAELTPQPERGCTLTLSWPMLTAEKEAN